jgi:hypothetical protein
LKFYRITARTFVSLLFIGVASIASVVTAAAQSTTTLTQVVNKATSTTLSATSSVNPSTFGQSVTLSTTLTAPLSSMATGTVQWFDGAITLGSPVPVTSGSSSLTISSLGGGSHTLTATYSGDSNFSAATSTPLTQVVQPAMPGTGGFAPVAVASSFNPSIYQNSVTFTATVPSGATGAIAFMDATTTLGTVPITRNSAAFSISTLVASTHSITAVYSGDINFLSATSAAVAQVVNKAPTVESVYATPPNGLTVGSSVTFTALVNTGMLTPTGSVTFMDGATNLGTGTVSAATATNLLPFSADFTHQWTSNNSGAAAPTVFSGTTGPDGASRSATAISYPDTTGIGNFSGQQITATGSFAGQQMAVSFWAMSITGMQLTVNLTDGSGANTVSAIVTTTGTWQRFVLPMTLSAGANPNAILSIVVANQGAGSVSLYGAQLEQAATAGVYVQTSGASASGQGGVATFSTSALLDGSHAINVTYSGDSNYLGGNGALNQALAVGKGTAIATVSSSLPSSNYGQSVTFTASVSGPNTTPTGAVTFFDGATSIGTATLDGSGHATISNSLLTAGSHSITIQFGGDSNFSAAISAAITQSVATVSATVTATSTVNPSTFGQSIDLDVTVTGTGAVPTGTVVVTDGGTSIGTLTLDASGTAHLTTSTLTVGSHALTFTYSGDSNYTH